VIALDRGCYLEAISGHHAAVVDSEIFGQRVRAARNLRGMTQGDLCFALREHGFRYNDGNVRSWEKGRHWPEARAVPFIADVLGVSTDYLYGRDAALTAEGASGERPGGRAARPRSETTVSSTEEAARALAEGVTAAAELAPPPPPGERRRRSRRATDPPPDA
jgi:transcriptional regulator with XRE-family HTH domain